MTSSIFQLLAASGLGIFFFILAFRLPEKYAITILLLLIPFELIDSRFGTLNTFLIYLFVFAFLLRGRISLAPGFLVFFVLLFAYAISFSLTEPEARLWHLFYLVGFVANILIFYMIYNYCARTENWQYVVTVLFWSNLLVVLACLLEIALGDTQVAVLGIKEWTLGGSRAHIGRLVGPFGTTHTTADYLVAQCLLIAFWLFYKKPAPVRPLIALFMLNCFCLVATGDRGGFLGIIIAAILFLVAFRKSIGSVRILGFSLAGVGMFAVVSFAVVQYTDFGRLYERLETTDIQEENPRRIGIRRGLEYFQERPITGFGPTLDVSTKSRTVGNVPYRPWPHNLFLSILATTGIVGLIAWISFFAFLTLSILRVSRIRLDNDPLLSQVPKLGLLIMVLFMAGELRIEFLRSDFTDYQNYLFVLFAVFLACAHEILRKSKLEAAKALSADQSTL